MDELEIKTVKMARINELNQILAIYRSEARKSKKLLAFLGIIVAIALYFMFYELLGGIWGYVLTFVIIGVSVYCINTLGISFKNATVSDGKLAYRACVAMEELINIRKGVANEYGVNFICVSEGTHLELYREFSRLYPELSNKDLEKLARMHVKHEDIFC